MREFAVVVLAATLLWAAPAEATNCRDWERAYPDQKAGIIDDMIHRAISGQRGREYQVNRGRIERCLQGYARDMGYDFDDACSDSRTAGMQALNNIFKDYIWSCVQ